MYAIVEIAGQQFKVEKGQEIYVHRLESSEGEKVQFDSVMMIDNNGKLNIGTPVISGAQVTATVVEHMKGDKVFIFHKKRRKGYQKFNGHREYLSLIKIDEIIESGATPAKKEEKKTEAAPKKKPAAKKKATPAKKETAAKKTTPAKKAVAKADDKKDKPKADTTEKKKEAATKPSAKKSVEKKEEKKADAGTSKEVKSAKKEEAPKKEDSGDSKEEKK